MAVAGISDKAEYFNEMKNTSSAAVENSIFLVMLGLNAIWCKFNKKKGNMEYMI
jgi:hypothetical protein